MKTYRPKQIILIIFFASLFKADAQLQNTAFASIDKRVKTISALSPDTLAYKLTRPYKTETEKVRALFRWITENIAYDVQGYHNVTGIYAGLWELAESSGADDIYNEYNNRIVAKVLKEKKAVCDGYSRLFKTLCDYAKIKCEIVTGYIRWSTDPIGAMTNREHAWNAVFINNSWKLIDVTWASGYANHEVTQFTKRYNDFYFFTNPIHFFNDHYPADNKWSLMPITPTLYQFYNFPFYYPEFYKFKIISLKPITGYIDVPVKNKVVQIELELEEKVKDMYVYEYSEQDSVGNDVENTDWSTTKPQFRIDKKKIIYSYEVRSDKSDKLSVILNDELILTYGVRILR